MENKASFKRVVACNGGSANGTVLETYHCKVKKCQQIEKVVKISSLSLLSLFKKRGSVYAILNTVHPPLWNSLYIQNHF